jgi:hypothetical protein
MNYWLTIHWPLRADERINVAWRNWIFLAEGWEASGQRIQPDDRVFVYETESAPRVREGARLIERRPGRKGIVALATVTTPLEYERNIKTEILEDGRERRWSYRARTHTDQECRLSLVELRNLLHKPGFSARVPGGLMGLREVQFNRILLRSIQEE